MVEEKGFELEVIDYINNPPTVKELDEICQGLNKEPLEIIRVKDKLFKELGFSKSDKKSRQKWLKIMVENPRLIDRPIVVYQGKYVLAKPPEKVLEILS